MQVTEFKEEITNLKTSIENIRQEVSTISSVVFVFFHLLVNMLFLRPLSA